MGDEHGKFRTDVKVRDVYKLGKTLGTGGFSVVKLAVERSSGKQYACKIMSLPDPTKGKKANDPSISSREDILKEIDILARCDHPNVMFLKEYFEENNKVYLITELLTGGELLDAVLEKGHYSEADARLCFHKLLEGLSYLHTKKIAHRDLKLENLLLDRKEDIATVKIADFGLAKRAAESTMETICGTPQYVAPEVILGIPGNKYTFTVDLWSAGVILFILLGGYPPFYDEHEPRLFMKIRRGQYSFDDPVWSKVSETAKDLIRKLLTTDPDKRLSAEEALKHEWFKDASVEKNELHGTVANFREQVEKRASQLNPHAFAGEGGDEEGVRKKLEEWSMQNKKDLDEDD